MLVLVPAILGGIWQLTELASIGTSYIRFFSVSQLVSDGLLIMFLLFIVLYSFSILANSLLTDWLREHLSEDSDGTSTVSNGNPAVKHRLLFKHSFSSFSKIGSYLIQSIFLLYIVCGIWMGTLRNPFSLYIVNNKTTASELFLLLQFIASGIVMLIVIIMSLLITFGYRINMKSSRIRPVKYLIFILLIILSFFVIVPFAKIFHQSFLLPEKFKNAEYVQNRVKANNRRMERWSFEYYNDQYIFITVQDSSGKEFIEVLKFDAIFPSDEK